MSTIVPSNNYSVALGTSSTSPFITIIQDRPPTPFDGPNQGYPQGQRWLFFQGTLTANITAATNSNPAVLTAMNTFVTGQLVAIVGVGGMTELNGNEYAVLSATPSTLTIDVDSTFFGVYTSGGVATISTAVEYFLTGYSSTNGVVAANWVLISEEMGGTTGVDSITASDPIAVSSSTGNVNISLAGIVQPAHGGTGSSAIPSAGQVLVGNNSGIYGAVNTVPVSSGGTGASTIPANGQLLIGNGAGYDVNNLTAGSNITITNGPGTISIASTGGALLIPNQRIFSAVGVSTYIPTATMKYCIVEGVGGGGGGGGAIPPVSGPVTIGGAGGGGGYFRIVASAAAIGSSQLLTVGAGGTAGAATGASTGGTGGTTSFGSLGSASGGIGGVGGTVTSASAPTSGGGAGGTGTSGGFNSNGSGGAGSVAVAASISFVVIGAGGSSYFGGGASGLCPPNVPSNGLPGTAFGGGGGGAFANTTPPGMIGGPGYQGVVIVTEYF